VSRGNVTRHDDMKDMLRRLASTHSQILGAVINNF
jgi:Mrp family chromosome partitioning ATPase